MDPNDVRGCKFDESDLVLDESACGSKLIIEDNVQAPNGCGHQSVRAKMSLEDKGIFEWDIIIEKTCIDVWVGVCTSDNFIYDEWAGGQPNGWVFGTYGHYYNSNDSLYCCSPFRNDDTKITVHLNMNERTCAFTVNGTKYPVVSKWNNLPSKLYPVVSLCYPGRVRIQPCQQD